MTPPDGFKIPDHWSRCLELKGKDDVDNCGAATEETSGSQVSGSQASGSQAAGSQRNASSRQRMRNSLDPSGMRPVDGSSKKRRVFGRCVFE